MKEIVEKGAFEFFRSWVKFDDVIDKRRIFRFSWGKRTQIPFCTSCLTL
jgi:hypothetical protein